MNRLEQTKALLTAAIDKYREECREIVRLKKQRDFDREIFNTSLYPVPLSNYLVLSTLRWFLDHRSSDDFETDAFYGVVEFLDIQKLWDSARYDAYVRDHGRRAADDWVETDRKYALLWTKEIRGWPADDRAAVLAWLLEAQTWPVEGELRGVLAVALKYWQSLV